MLDSLGNPGASLHATLGAFDDPQRQGLADAVWNRSSDLGLNDSNRLREGGLHLIDRIEVERLEDMNRNNSAHNDCLKLSVQQNAVRHDGVYKETLRGRHVFDRAP